MYKLVLIIVVVCIVSRETVAQERAVVSTAVPFLGITPDARGGGMGEVGAATSPDVYSMYYNAAKYVFANHKTGVAFGYLPWMRHLISGQNLYTLNAYSLVGGRQAIALGVRLFQGKSFSLDEEKFSPSDYAIDMAYSRRFGSSFSAALTLRYVHTRLGKLKTGESLEFDPSGAMAFDVSCYYKRPFAWGKRGIIWGTGLNLSNLGTKIASFTEKKEGFLPAYLRLGTSLEMEIADKHSLLLALDLGKLLVKEYDPEAGDEGVLKNVLGSFGNSDFLKSVVWQLGVEYNWQKVLFARAGYFHESEDYGDRRYFTLGTGGHYAGWMLDFSYLIATGDNDVPYKGTFRLSLGYHF
ncbi:type IX secretion system outer membrane channel protein PorV [Butyricimonas sp.]|uniref:type IX secretion system outer membrane channel protein PorV n=1 Tax=Butyricimonas sp. TaxID=1969738 RepID=UPI0025C5A188|nr:type IX secretion system outer membrane channel protein PorV [Butyricimonas sp.]